MESERAEVCQHVARSCVEVLPTHVGGHGGALFQVPAHNCMISILDVVVGGGLDEDISHLQVGRQAKTSLQAAVTVGNKIEVADYGKMRARKAHCARGIRSRARRTFETGDGS